MIENRTIERIVIETGPWAIRKSRFDRNGTTNFSLSFGPVTGCGMKKGLRVKRNPRLHIVAIR